MVEVRDVKDQAELTGQGMEDAQQRQRVGPAGASDDDRTGLEDRMRRDELANAALDRG